MTTLGRGEWQVELTERGGGDLFDVVPWTSISGERALDTISSATVLFPPDRLGGVRSWEHEVVQYRRREGETAWGSPVWAGPVVGRTYSRAKTGVRARDLMQWMERRWLPIEREYTEDAGTDADLATIFTQYVTDALSGDASPGLSVSAATTGITGDREVYPEQFRIAMDELRELARTGVDFTMSGRTCLVGGEEVPTTVTALLLDEHFAEDYEVDADGLDMTTEAVVTGAGGGAAGFAVYGQSGGVDATVGLLQRVFNESSILDDDSALAAAASRVALLGQEPLTVTGKLLPSAPVDFADLIPGARFTLNLTERAQDVVRDMRLHQVSWSVNVGDEGISEAINVRFVSVGGPTG